MICEIKFKKNMKPVKFIQLVSHNSYLIALDEDGRVWEFRPSTPGGTNNVPTDDEWIEVGHYKEDGITPL